MTLAAGLRWVGAAILALLFLTIALIVYVIATFVYPDESKFGTIQDEALAAGVVCKPFNESAECAFTKPMPEQDYFAQMDRGYDKNSVWHNDELLKTQITALNLEVGGEPVSPATLRKLMTAGRNTWIVWTGGNDRFWDKMASQYTFGNFDLLKIISSHPSQYYGRNRPPDGEVQRNRWYYLGLVNEPCFAAAKGPDHTRFGLWLDQRVKSGECEGVTDPFADELAYPGVKTGARGTMVTYQGEKVKLPVGSYYGEPTGIVGLRLFPNPNFDEKAAKRWDPERYYTDPDYYLDNKLVRPYRVGMSCAFCHVGPSPVNPPADPENPQWQNLNSNPGAQYFWVNRVFIWNTRHRGAGTPFAENETSMVYQWFHTNPPGTLDTSLVSTDYLNNPRTMNAVYSVDKRMAPALRWGSEKLEDDEARNAQFDDFPQTASLSAFWDEETQTVKTPRVLKDGADSVGVLGALNRVYLNIGLFSEEWVQHFFPVVGGQKISPILIEHARKNSSYWNATERKTPDMAAFFLIAAVPDLLKEAVSAEAYQQLVDQELATQGKAVFIDNCAACHYSQIPKLPADVEEGCEGGGNGPQYRQCWDKYWAWTQTDAFKVAMHDKAFKEGFEANDFFSTERRIPVDVLGTNACSPMASNALEGDIWDSFSSSDYKQLPPAKELTTYYPYEKGYQVKNSDGETVYSPSKTWQPLGNGRGYTRPASLISLWTSAPFLLNNAVGYQDSVDYPEYEAYYYSPSIKNRLRLFEASMDKMLNPEKRRRDTLLGDTVPGYLFRTTAPSCLKIARGQLPDTVKDLSQSLHWVAPWAFTAEGDLAIGPFPKDFPPSLLFNTQLLLDNDQTGNVAHAMKLGRLGLDLLGVAKSLGGRCDYDELADKSNQLRAQQILTDSGIVDGLLSMSKCSDMVVNRGHYFGHELSDAKKQALIEYLKTI